MVFLIPGYLQALSGKSPDGANSGLTNVLLNTSSAENFSRIRPPLGRFFKEIMALKSSQIEFVCRIGLIFQPMIDISNFCVFIFQISEWNQDVAFWLLRIMPTLVSRRLTYFQGDECK